jgi:Tetratricopeptide repeat.
MKKFEIAAANLNELVSLKNFIKLLAEKLPVEINPEQPEQIVEIYPEQKVKLLEIAQNIIDSGVPNLRELKARSLNVKSQLINILKTLNTETLTDLSTHAQSPNFLENIVNLATFEREIDEAKLIESETRRYYSLARICRSIAQAGDFDRALEIASLIPNPDASHDAYSGISGVLQRAGDFDRAFEIASLIPGNYHRFLVCSNIAGALVRAGDFDRALKVASLIPDSYTRRYTRSHIARVLARTGDFDRALEIAKSIADKENKNNAFLVISKALAVAWHFDRARKINKLITDEDTCSVVSSFILKLQKRRNILIESLMQATLIEPLRLLLRSLIKFRNRVRIRIFP